MKPTTIVLFAVLCISFSLSAPCCEKCISDLTKDLDQNTEQREAQLPVVKVTKEASFTGFEEKGFCGRVFKTHGACCDQKDLHARAKAWKQRLQARFSKLNGGMNKFADILEKKKDHLAKMLEKKTDKATGSESTKPADTTENTSSQVNQVESTSTQSASIATTHGQARILTNTVTPGFSQTNSASSVTHTPVNTPTTTDTSTNTETATDSTTSTQSNSTTTTETSTHSDTKPTGTSTQSNSTTTTETSTHSHSTTNGSSSHGHKDKKTEKRNHIFGKARSSLNHCFKALMKIRYNGLCLRCSGAALSSFEEATGSYKVKENVCPEAIKACAPLYAILSEAQKTYVSLAKVKAKLNKRFSKLANFPEPSEAAVSEWSQCAQDTETCLKNTTLLNSLCSKLTITKQSAENGDNPEVLEDADLVTEAGEVTTRLLSESSTSGEGHLIVDSSAKVDLENGFVSGATEAETNFDGSSSAMIGSAVAAFMVAFSLI